MKFVVFGDDYRPGLLEDEAVLDLTRTPRAGRSFSSLLSVIEAGAEGLDRVRAFVEKSRGSDEPGLWTDLTHTRLHAPFPGQRFAMAGSNNADHVASAFTNMGTPRTPAEIHAAARARPVNGFWSVARPVMGPGAHIEIPDRAHGYFDYEGEPAIVLAKQDKDIRSEDIDQHVWGVTLVIDWSIREPVWPPRPQYPWVVEKNFDCSKSIGPCIVVDEIDLDDLHVETTVNSQLRQRFSADDMIHSFPEILEYLSRDFTVFPGDVISGGTGCGTAIDQTVPDSDGKWPHDLFLSPGDEIVVSSPNIGVLANSVVPKSRRPTGYPHPDFSTKNQVLQ